MSRVFSIIAAVLLIAGCGSPEDAFIGEWLDSEEELTIVFSDDGTLTLGDEWMTISGTYELLDDGEMQIELREGDEVESVVATYEFEGDVLLLTAEGDTLRLERVED